MSSLSQALRLGDCRLRSRDYSRPLASELDVKVSLHPAQAWNNAPSCACGVAFAGRGFDTVRPLACTCLWQLRWIRTRLPTPSAPPIVLYTMWWLCQPVTCVIGCAQTGQSPPCSFQRWVKLRFPRRVFAIFTPRRSSREVSHAGSYGLQVPCIFVYLVTDVAEARQSQWLIVFPSWSFA